MKCVITGHAEKKSTKEKISRRCTFMKCFVTGHAGEKIKVRRQVDERQVHEMRHNGNAGEKVDKVRSSTASYCSTAGKSSKGFFCYRFPNSSIMHPYAWDCRRTGTTAGGRALDYEGRTV
jgi:hypothetical protein